MPAPAFREQSGFSLVEVLIAMVVLTVGVLGTLALVDNANQRTSDTKAREAATNLARDLVESARTVPFNNITQADLESDLSTRAGLGDTGAAAGWQIDRRNFTYTVTYTICTVDDVSDGYGTSAAHDSSFCPGTISAGAAGADRNPVDFRRVVFKLSWKDTRGNQTVEQAALVNSTYRGPFPKTITANPTGTIYTGTGINFTATLSSNATAVKWYVDGRLQDGGSGSATSWTYNWDLGTACAAGSVPDGTYFVSAVAYDRNGGTGGSKAAAVDINRCPPARPTGFEGGRNWGSVELTWAANPEPDVIGYEVFRGATLVCALTTATSCRDATSAATSASGPLTYTVVAYDQSPSGRRASVASSPLTVLPDCGSGTCNTPPSRPDVSYSGGTLTITAPSVQDPDTGDGIVFYRVYRTTGTTPPTGPGQRYDTVDNSGATVTWTDPQPGSYHYWVTAVDQHYAESAFSAVVP